MPEWQQFINYAKVQVLHDSQWSIAGMILSSQPKYTRRADNQGWLTVKLTKTQAKVALCEYTKVELTREADGLVFFVVADGNSGYVGQEAFLHKTNASQYLSNVGPNGPARVQVQYRGKPAWEDSPFKGRLLQQWGTETFNGTSAEVTLNSIWGQRYSPIPAGVHAILAPDRSHGNISTAGYVAATPGMHGNDVWFPLGLNGVSTPSGRYMHAGHLSEGCITTHELSRWAALYDYLISSRDPGSRGKLVGRVTVNS